jgi:hypothetical protein
LVADSTGTACEVHSAISQFMHFATAGWPQGFFFSNPTSTAQLSTALL